jgi:hypothetical protein
MGANAISGVTVTPFAPIIAIATTIIILITTTTTRTTTTSSSSSLTSLGALLGQPLYMAPDALSLDTEMKAC